MACPRLVLRRAVSLADFRLSAPGPRSARRNGFFHCAAAPKYDTLTPGQREQVDAYLHELADWNTRMNLTAVRSTEEALERHINDSLALLPLLDACLEVQRPQRAGPPTVVDVGSGAGLPGLVLAIARPDWQVLLLDSLRKRCSFNEAAAAAAKAGNVAVCWARAEDAGRDPALREAHDLAVARAVAELRVLAELCLPLVRPGGHWLAAKGPGPEEEVAAAGRAITRLGGQLEGLQEVDSIGTDGRPRTAVLVRKVAATAAQYPRPPGTPKKAPL